MTTWLFSWKGITAGGLVLAAALVLAILLREGTVGNVASIVGLAVSVLGFVVTIWTVLDARLQIEEAGRRATEAIEQANAQARQRMEGIAVQLHLADCAAFQSAVEDLRQAARDGNWHRALYRGQECLIAAMRLAHDQRLTPQERGALVAAQEDFQTIIRFIEQWRLEGQGGFLRNHQVQALNVIIGILIQIRARLLHQTLGAPNQP